MRAQHPYPSLQCSLANRDFQKQSRECVRKPEECADVLDVDPLRVDGLDCLTFSVNETTDEGRIN